MNKPYKTLYILSLNLFNPAKTHMKKILVIIVIPLLLAFCKRSTETEIEVAKINVSSQTDENLQVAYDIVAYDFGNLVAEKLGDNDPGIMTGLGWKIKEDPSGGEPAFVIVLKGKALEKEDRLKTIFSDFISHKLAEYKRKQPDLDDVETMADYYLRIIETANIDTVWPKTSPTLMKFASKNDFNQTLQQRKKLFHPEGKRYISSRRMSDKLGKDLTGSFYTVTYVYDDKKTEEVTMEKIDGQYKLLGYHFLVNGESK
jgi:hypothetical protein